MNRKAATKWHRSKFTKNYNMMIESIEKLKTKLQRFSKKELIELILNNDQGIINESPPSQVEYKLKTFYNALHAAKVGVWEWSITEFKLKIVTDTFSFLGHDVGTFNLDFDTFMRTVHPDDRNTVNSGFERYVTAYPEAHTYSYRMISESGQYHWVMSTGRVSKFDQNGNPLLVAGIYSDVTEMREKQIQIELSAFALQHASDQIFRLDKDGIVMSANEVACMALDLSLEEIKNKPMETFAYHVQFSAAHWPDFWNQLKEQGTITTETKLKNDAGEIYYLELVSNYYQFNDSEYNFIFARDVTKWKLAQRNLKQSEGRFKKLSNMAKEGVLFLRNGTIIDVNNAVVDIVGYQRSELLGKDFRTFLDEKLIEQIKDNIQNELFFELEAKRRDGEDIVIEITAKPYDQGMQVVIMNDVTAKKKAENELLNHQRQLERLVRRRTMELEERNLKLAKQEREFSTLLYNLQGMAYRSLNDPDWTVVFVSDGSKALTGYDPEEFTSGKIRFENDIIVQSYAEETWGIILEALKNKTSYQVTYPIITKDGESKWALERGVGVYDETDGQLLTLEGVIVDITLEKEKELQLRLAQITIDKAPIAIEWLNKDGEFVYVNEMASVYTGFENLELLQKKVFDLNPNLDVEQWQRLFNNMKDQDVKGFLTTRLTSDKREFPVEINSTNIIFEGNEYNCAYLQDITERQKTEMELFEAYGNLKKSQEALQERSKELNYLNQDLESQKKALENSINELKSTQTQLIQSEKMASLGVLVAGIAHELNNPLSYVMSGSEALKLLFEDIFEVIGQYNRVSKENCLEKLDEIALLKANLNYDELVRELGMLVGNINEGAGNAAAIVKGLRSFSRLDGGDLVVYNVHKCLDSALVILQNSYKHRIIINKQYGDIPQIKCFPLKLNQVFMNLIHNSIQAIEDKGEIKIRSFISDKYNVDYLAIEIQDNGQGIPLAIQNRIFEPFYTSKDVGKGTGLGLSISLGIVKDHQGIIDFESQEGRGSTFTVYLPITEK